MVAGGGEDVVAHVGGVNDYLDGRRKKVPKLGRRNVGEARHGA